MTLKSKLLAAILATFAVSAMTVTTVYGADDKPAETKAEKADVKADKPAPKKKAKKHSHTAEKTGVTPSEPADNGEPVKKPLHNHQEFHK